MSFVTNIYALCNKGIVFDITPSFVTICVNWIPIHTYGVYLILSLKPGATTSFFNEERYKLMIGSSEVLGNLSLLLADPFILQWPLVASCTFVQSVLFYVYAQIPDAPRTWSSDKKHSILRPNKFISFNSCQPLLL